MTEQPYDIIIVGAGISGLVSALMQARRGRRVLSVATQTGPLLPQHSGSIELLGRIDGEDVTDIAAALPRLSAQHPYRRIGIDRIASLMKATRALVADVGLAYRGHDNRNHYRITPLGIPVPAWLTLDGYLTIDTLDELHGQHVALMRAPGYLDQVCHLVAYNLERLGATVTIHDFSLRALQATTPTPRPVTMSRKLDSRSALDSIATDINAAGREADITVMPAIMGDDEAAMTSLRRRVEVNLKMMATLPPTVAGASLNMAWQHYSLMLGVTVMMGETVVSATSDGHKVLALHTASGKRLSASHYIFATGALAGAGLQATRDGNVVEGIMNLDHDGGVTLTDESLHPSLNGKTLDNVQVVGHLLGDVNSERHDSEGVDLMTALSI